MKAAVAATEPDEGGRGEGRGGDAGDARDGFPASEQRCDDFEAVRQNRDAAVFAAGP
jgi:hypothetical protein